MEDRIIKDKAIEIESSTKDSMLSILEKIEGKNLFSIFTTIMTEGYKISSSFNNFINSINFDQKIASNNEYGILYDLFGSKKLDSYKKNKDFDVLFNFKENKIWGRKSFENGILKDYPELFSLNETEKKIIIFNYYKTKAKDNKNPLNNIIINSSGDFDLFSESIKNIENNKNNSDEKTIFANIINLNYAENNSNDERQIYFNKINEITSIKIGKEKINDLLKNIENLLENKEIKKIVKEYIDYKINKNKEEIKKLSINYFDITLKEVEGKKVILEYIKIKDFIVSIYGRSFLSTFSRFIIRKILKSLDNNFTSTNNYKILKYVITYVVSKNDMEGYYSQIFFKEFEDEYYKFDQKYKEKNKLIKSKNKEKIYNFLKLKKIVTILSFSFGILLTLSFIYGSNISNYIKTSVLNNNLSNKNDIILLSKDDLLFTGSINIKENYYMWNIVDKIFDKYSQKKGINNYTQKEKNELIYVISKKYLGNKEANKLPIGFEVDMGKLEIIFQKEISK